MQLANRLVSAFALTLLSASAFAATTTYTSSAAFLPQVAPGAYTEAFTGLINPASGSFSSGGFSYNISAPNDVYVNGDFIGTNQENDPLTLTFTSGNVTALGGNFYASNFNDAFQSTLITLTLSDGTIESFTPTSVSDSYRGFTSSGVITSLVISGAGLNRYAGLDNLTVGTVSSVPEPTSLAMFGLGLAGLLAARRRAA